MLLSGCSPADHAGVRLDADRVPVVENCGGYIERVDVHDVHTGRWVWSAQVDGSQGGDEEGRVALGALPPGWFEGLPLELEPRPTTWRFEIFGMDDDVIVVADADFEPGRMYRPGGGSESVAHFEEQTCSGIPLSLAAQRAVFAGLGVVFVGGVVAIHVWGRRKRAIGVARSEDRAAVATVLPRPVQGSQLLESPEMGLRSPGEVELERRCVDEGTGTGFGNLDPMAYAERVIVADDAKALFRWYNAQLRALGWSAPCSAPQSGALQFRRGSAELIQVQVLPMQEHWSRHFSQEGVVGRVSFSVAGSLPADPDPSQR
jgi:hypothetical protein